MKCTKCNSDIAPTMQGFSAGVLMGTKWNCIAFCCPACDAVLSAQIDPIAIKSDIVAGVIKALKNTP